MTKTVANILIKASLKLKPISNNYCKHEARLLLAHAMNETKEKIIAYPENIVSPEIESKFNSLIDRRLAHEPIAKIIGIKEFWGQNFIVNKDVLDPRPDSETLIEAVIKYFPDKKTSLKILDLGTGSGCLLLTLLSEYVAASGVGVDFSENALLVANKNSEKFELTKRAKFIYGDFSCINKLVFENNFDIVISNPPYIALDDRGNLDPSVRVYDPDIALFGGIDGFDAYKSIANSVKNKLSKKGYFFVEAGIGQGKKIKEIFTNINLSFVELVHDLSGIERCLIFKNS